MRWPSMRDWMRIFLDNAAVANGADVPAGVGGANWPDAR